MASYTAASGMAGSRMNNIGLQRLWDDTRCVMINIGHVPHIAFGPLFQTENEALHFLAYMKKRFPHISIASINTERLCIYYKEFLDETP